MNAYMPGLSGRQDSAARPEHAPRVRTVRQAHFGGAKRYPKGLLQPQMHQVACRQDVVVCRQEH